jgi:hypothetical protein
MPNKKSKYSRRARKSSAKNKDEAPKKRRRFPIPIDEKKPINTFIVELPDDTYYMYVDSFIVSVGCTYRPESLRAELNKHMYILMQSVLTRFKDFKEGAMGVMEGEAEETGFRYSDPELQRFLDRYSTFAYETFINMIQYKMYELPELLLELIEYRVFALMEEDRFYIPLEKSIGRKMWDDLVRQYGRALKEDWLNIKPGPVEGTSKSERAEMLAFYNTTLVTCQSAKRIYKQNKGRDWRGKVKESHEELGEFIESVADHRPSDLAILITGRKFNKIIGKDFRGSEEVRRQLGIARKEVRDDTEEPP